MSSRAPRGSAPAGLPAWKQAILERKRAKLASGVGLFRGSPPRSPPGAGGKEPPVPPRPVEGEPEGERLVVAESLGPLRENPFMRLESERRRRRGRRRAPAVAPEAPSSPQPPPPPPSRPPAAAPEPPALTQLLELYSSMPGIRTIRADNILIIESRGGDGAKGHHQPRRKGPPSASSAEPLRRLLSQAGAPLTEIRATEVVIYEPQPPQEAPRATAPDAEQEDKEAALAEAGRVSRLMKKFDTQKPPGGGGSSGSSSIGAGRGRWRGGEAPRPEASQAADAVPNASPRLEGTSLAAKAASTTRPFPPCSILLGGGGFVRKIGANSFTVNPRGRRFPGHTAPGPPSAGPAPPLLSNGPVGTEGAQNPRGPPDATDPKPVPSPSAAVASPPAPASSQKPKSEETLESPSPLPLPPQPRSASPDSSATAGLPRPLQPFGSGGTAFEIRPAPKPDLAAIPAHDLQAQALASLRLNSRNSFLFVPHRKGEAPSALEPIEVLPALPGAVPEKHPEMPVPVTFIDEDWGEPEPGLLPPLRVLSPRLEGFDVPHDGNLALEMEDSSVPMYRSHTFTIVPKRKPPAAGLETFNRAWVLEEDDEEEEVRAKARTGVPHEELGHLLKKRYPTVNEIEVIGGYLSLDKSCMSKSGSQRKKMKISFNETSLQTMFEYPSESSLVEEEEEEEEEYATEVDETPTALLIPRPSSIMNSNTTNSGLSGYTPKHSLEFDKWQQDQYEGTPPCAGAFPQDADLLGNQVMLTPADKSSLSDFSSEPALYF
ncbi:taperin isoform X2 [Sceloporus undulatus]|uniref:taperin isoform X2 n=1 Tax=Sceloporus undulatus TaxID=8520 RepID=UPI001C4B5D46|nr:taperin isoform X2 [Sceloporus undulatus]